MRTATVNRKTAETEITLALTLDGAGKNRVATGIGFFDHMLDLLARHALFDLAVTAKGDLQVDGHHTMEDVGICFGKALAEALGDKRGIVRYGWALLPMDEALARVALDLSGRGQMEWRWRAENARACGTEAMLAREFMRAVSATGGVNLHVDLLEGVDPHHCLEAIFKGVGRALRMAVALDAREGGIPSTKGVL